MTSILGQKLFYDVCVWKLFLNVCVTTKKDPESVKTHARLEEPF